MNQLEEHIKQNRSQLDHIEDPRREVLWKNIQKGLNPERKRPNGWTIHLGTNWRWSIAIAITLMIGMGIWRYTQTPVESQPTLAQFYPELIEQENHYRQLITEKENDLQIGKLDPQKFGDIFQELQILEEVHAELIADLPNYISEDDLVRTLVKYYERKIMVLERLSREIEKRNHDEKKQEQFI